MLDGGDALGQVGIGWISTVSVLCSGTVRDPSFFMADSYHHCKHKSYYSVSPCHLSPCSASIRVQYLRKSHNLLITIPL